MREKHPHLCTHAPADHSLIYVNSYLFGQICQHFTQTAAGRLFSGNVIFTAVDLPPPLLCIELSSLPRYTIKSIFADNSNTLSPCRETGECSPMVTTSPFIDLQGIFHCLILLYMGDVTSTISVNVSRCQGMSPVSAKNIPLWKLVCKRITV